MRKLIFLLICFFAGISLIPAQTTAVTGTVRSAEDNEPVVGASVIVKGTTIGTLTDFDGRFSLNVPSSATLLVISYIGTETVEVPVSPTIHVQLAVNTQDLDEIIVVAYGTSTKKSFTGSAANIRQERLENIQTASLTKALEGAAPGIQVSEGSGQPGSGANIRIRGIGSINASSMPLYIVDGAAFDGDISTINIEDISSITVLKDATSAALYGARGANGVILITTKRGEKGRLTANTKVNLGAVSRAIPQYDRVGIKDYHELSWETLRNSLVFVSGKTEEEAATIASSGGADGLIGKLGGYNIFNVPNDNIVGTNGKFNESARQVYGDDWEDILFRTALRQDYNVSLSGGNEQTSYYASAGYNKEEGIVKWSDYERFTARVGVESQVNSWLKLDFGLSGASSFQNGFMAEGTYTTNPFYYTLVIGPIFPVYQYGSDGQKLTDSKGNVLYDMGGGLNDYTWEGHTRSFGPNSNLAVTLPLDERSNERELLSARLGTEIRFLQDFKLRITANQDINTRYQTTYQNYKYGDAEGVNGRSTKTDRRYKSYTFNQVLTWEKSFSDHNIALLAGHENYLLEYRYVSATRTGFVTPSTELIMGAIAEGSTSYTDKYALEGYFFQANYDYKNKYYLSSSLRRDGSSRFYKDARWGLFWSLGGSWRLSEETFIGDIAWINNLKLKASYGEQGNDNILNSDGTTNYYGWPSLYAFSDAYNENLNNGNLSGSIHSQLLNKELAWEKNGNLNTGVEFGLFNRLRGEIDVFRRQSGNLLFQVPNPQSTGIEYKWGNIGTLKNTGIEIALGADIIKNKDLKWSIDINATHYKNKITKMPSNPDGSPQEIINGTKKLSEGHSIYDFWLRDYAGVDPEDGSALYYKDILDADGNVTGKETTSDHNVASYYYVGDAIPVLYGGITNNLSYKEFELSVLLSYQLGGKIYDSHYATLLHPGSYGYHWSSDILKRWQKPGDITDIPRLQNGYTAANIQSSRFLTDASYLSLRNVTLSYTLPGKIQRTLDLKGGKIFVTGDNLGLLTKRKGLNPQQNFDGTSDYTYITNRVISAGINLTF
jgi:TonB-linked SusC/RagA family outer membrane protein